MTTSAWDRRIARAKQLACAHPPASGLLQFYVEIARLQKKIYDRLASMRRSDLNPALLNPYFPALLSLIGRIGPKPLAEAAKELARHEDALQELLIDPNPSGEIEIFFGRAMLQPYAENLARRSDVNLANSPSTCPFCGEKPQVGVLREEGNGGKRSLICSLCATEWEFQRVLCPGCGEEAMDRLPVYTAGEFDYVRVEACESCHTYIKSIDLTKNGLAVPVVDELATIPLTVWAEQNGYTKLQLNLLST